MVNIKNISTFSFLIKLSENLKVDHIYCWYVYNNIYYCGLIYIYIYQIKPILEKISSIPVIVLVQLIILI